MAQTITVELSDEHLALLDQAALRAETSRDNLIARAIKGMAHLHQQHSAALEMSLAQADAGQSLPADEVFGELDEIIKTYEKKHAA
jgi:predicted transcriptional regulator